MARTVKCLRNTVIAGLLMWIFYFISLILYLEMPEERNRKNGNDVVYSWSGKSQNGSLLLRQSIYKSAMDKAIPNYPDMNVINKLFNATELWNLGHNGVAVVLNKTLLPPLERKKMEKAQKEHGFNEYLSNILPLNRKLPNIRPESCDKVHYKFDLPKASVVICFMNESWSALLRTVHSVINTSPDYLLEEIILVDDFSDKSYLKHDLDVYVSKLRKVRIVRAKKRQGLIRARLLGFRATKAPVVIFLDSHCECFPGWFEPIVGRIAENETNIPTPVIQVIDTETFRVSVGKASHIGIITFPDLSFDWIMIPNREKRRLKSASDPIRSPAMAGGLFAVSKTFFERIGTYDPELDTWGGENAELSLKGWMCGGAIEILPCSQVAHIFRKHSNYKPASTGNFILKNIARVAQVWLDSYKTHVRNIDGHMMSIGNVSQRIQLRQNLKCHSFQWYIDNVYPEIYIPGQGVLTGQIRSKSQRDQCIHWEHKAGNKTLKLMPCDTKQNVSWDFTDLDEIKFNENTCWDGGFIDGQVLLDSCHYGQGWQQWQYVDGMIKSPVNGKCLSVTDSDLGLKTCLGNVNQEWLWHKHRQQRNLN